MEGSVRLLVCLVCILPMGESATLLSALCLEQNRCSQNPGSSSLLELGAARFFQTLQDYGGGRAALWESEIQVWSSPLGSQGLRQPPTFSGPLCPICRKATGTMYFCKDPGRSWAR